MNLAILKGNLGKDPEVNTTNSGTSVCRFSLATTRRRKNGDEWEEETCWHNITAFGKTGEFIHKYFRKGDPILIHGRIDNRKYEKDGETKYFSGIVVDQAEFCSKPSGNKGGSKPKEQKPADQHQADMGDDFDDDIPF